MIHTKGCESLSCSKLAQFLYKVDRLFPTPLSEKVNIDGYARKLHDSATVCFAEDNGTIVGIVGGYTENVINNTAFISIVGVLPEFNGKGIATKLLSEFIERAKLKRLNAVHLYADKNNSVAVHIYQKLGFVDSYFENDPRPNDIHFVLYLQQKTALVTAIGSFSADIVIKNLKKNAFRIIGCDIYSRELIVDSYNVSAFYQVPKVLDEEKYLKAIDSICTNEKITHILPLTDVEVDFYNKNREFFEKKNIILCISPARTIELCRNKKMQQEFIDKEVMCINSIPTKYVSECTENPFEFPMICKPYDGRSSQGLKYLNTIEDWEAVKASDTEGKYIVQPRIFGNIVTVDVVCEQNGSIAVAIPRLELLRTQNGAGTSVKVFPDPRLEQCCIELANKLGVIGCVNFEFIRDDEGTYHYIECNPRFSGGVEFSCLVGYDCVSNHVRAFENKPIDEFKMLHETFIARKYEEYVTRII